MKKSYVSVILAFQITWIALFFIGIFYNYIRIRSYTQTERYYVNRGYPISWSGVSYAQFSVPFPLVKAPFLTKTYLHENFVKIIDIKIFSLLFFTTFCVVYLPIQAGMNILYTKPYFKFVSIFLFFVLLYGSFFFYFHWFPRI